MGVQESFSGVGAGLLGPDIDREGRPGTEYDHGGGPHGRARNRPKRVRRQEVGVESPGPEKVRGQAPG